MPRDEICSAHIWWVKQRKFYKNISTRLHSHFRYIPRTYQFTPTVVTPTVGIRNDTQFTRQSAIMMMSTFTHQLLDMTDWGFFYFYGRNFATKLLLIARKAGKIFFIVAFARDQICFNIAADMLRTLAHCKANRPAYAYCYSWYSEVLHNLENIIWIWLTLRRLRGILSPGRPQKLSNLAKCCRLLSTSRSRES